MTSSRRPRRPARWTAATLVLSVLLTGCGSGAEEQDEEQESPASVIPQPEYDDDETVRLPLAMVAPQSQAGQVPPDQEEHDIEIARTSTFGCQDTVSVVQSVPLISESPAVDALEYLIDDPLRSHGSPAFVNALAGSQELTVESVSVEQDTVTVQLDGEVTPESDCESWRILTQLETTVRMATGTGEAEILLGSAPLAETLGLPPREQPLGISEVPR